VGLEADRLVEALWVLDLILTYATKACPLPACTAPGFLDSEQDVLIPALAEAIVHDGVATPISGETEVAAPLLNSPL
jgi:hypothetical protein